MAPNPKSVRNHKESSTAKAIASEQAPALVSQVHARHILMKPTEVMDDETVRQKLAQIRDRLTQLAPIFLKNKYMLGDDFSMLDVAIAPLLWRLDHYAIELPKTAAPLLKYAERIFSRQGFIDALTRSSCPLVTPPSSPPARLVGRRAGTADRGPITPPVRGRISSWTCDPLSLAASAPIPMLTALIAGMDISA